MLRTGLTIALFTVSALGQQLSAQDSPPPEEGMRVRIWHRCVPTCQKATGTVLELSADSLWVELDRTQVTGVIPIASVQVVEVLGRRASGTWVGTGIGLLIGVFGGALVGQAIDPPNPQQQLNYRGGTNGMVVGALIGAVIGAASGAGAGAKRWIWIPR